MESKVVAIFDSHRFDQVHGTGDKSPPPGRDLALLLIDRLTAKGANFKFGPFQDEFGWVISFRVGERKYHVYVDLLLLKSAQEVWSLQRLKDQGLVKTMFSTRSKYVEIPEVCEILKDLDCFSNVRWMTEKEFSKIY